MTRSRIVRLPSPAIEAIVVGALVAAFYWGARLTDVVALGAFHDDAVYVALGKAISYDAGYHSIYAAGQPVHLKYPPGLPLVYAALWAVGGSLDTVARLIALLNLLVAGGAAAVFWWLARSALALRAPVCLAVVAAPFLLNTAVDYYNLAITEPYFVLLWGLALVTYLRMRLTSDSREGIARAALLGLVLAASAMMRIQAIAITAGIVGAALLDRVDRRRTLAITIVALAPVALWRWIHHRMVAAGSISTQPDEAPYLSWLPWDSPLELIATLSRATATNGEIYGRIMAANLAPVRPVGYVLAALLLGATAYGGWCAFRRHRVVALTTVANLLVVALWPFAQDRFLISCLPALGLLVGIALQHALSASRPQRLLVAGTVTLIMLSTGIQQVRLRHLAYQGTNPMEQLGFPHSGWRLLQNSRYIATVARWVLANTTPDDRILVETGPGVYLYTGRTTVTSSPAESEAAPSVFEHAGRFLAGRILEDSVTIVAAGSYPVYRDIAALEERCPGVLRFQGVIQGWTGANVFRVARDDACLRREFVSD